MKYSLLEDTEKMWDSVSVVDTQLDQYEINPKDIISVCAIVLDENNRLLVHYNYTHNQWVLPEYPMVVGQPEKKLIINQLHEECGLHANIDKLIGIKIYKKTHVRNLLKKVITKYTIIYLVKIDKNYHHINSDDEGDCSYAKHVSNIQSLTNIYSTHQQKKIVYMSHSQVVESSFYKEYKSIIDTLYQPFKIQLILDIDRTLLTSYIVSFEKHYCAMAPNHYILTQRWFPNHIVDYNCQMVYVWTRPYMYEFLEKLSNLTHVSYWTASEKVYQEKVLKGSNIDKFAKQIHYYDECDVSDDGVYKSIIKLNERTPIYDMDKTLMIDDYEINKKMNEHNCLVIQSWDVINIDSEKKIIQYKYDESLLIMLNNIRLISDKVIHNQMKIPQILQQFDNR